MCGRFVSASPPEEIAEYFGAVAVADPLEPRYNVAPTLDVYVVYEQPGSEPAAARQLDQFYWGLVPGFAKDMKIGARMINARSETAATNNSFRGSLARRRCIVPADGFYEWQKFEGSKAKQPFYIHRGDGQQLAMAGLWAEWRGIVAGEQVTVRSTTILTTEANDTLRPLHDRMPVILPRRAWDEWLDPANQRVERVQDLLVPAPASLLVMHPVAAEVGNARNEGAHLIDEIDPTQVVGAAQHDPSEQLGFWS